MSAGKIDYLLKIWTALLAAHNDEPPFKDHHNLYFMIDATPLPCGDAEWKTFNLHFSDDEEIPPDAPNWKKQKWDVWYCNPHQIIHNLLQIKIKIQTSMPSLTTSHIKSMIWKGTTVSIMSCLGIGVGMRQ